jgi:hypothetical protein
MKNILAIIAVLCALAMAGCGRQAAREAKADRARFQWYLDNTAGGYLRFGVTNKAWDAPVLKAFTNIAILRTWENATNAGLFSYKGLIDEAVAAGCTDPLVAYWKLRGDGVGARADAREAGEWTKVVKALEPTEYSPLNRFYAYARAANALQSSGTNWLMIWRMWQGAKQNADRLLREAATPPEEAILVADMLVDILERAPKEKTGFMDTVQTAVDQSFPKSWHRFYLDGAFEITRAWEARGTAVASMVSKEAFAEFEAHLAKAEVALNQAWNAKPTEATALKMMTVELGQGKGRPRMEQWFERAMSLNTNSWAAVRQKYNYLQPKWYGTDEDLMQFARACVTSTNWGGRIPLIMVDLHSDRASRTGGQQRQYYRQTPVWEDLHAAFERFFKLNPDAEGWRHNYFWFAYAAEQWDEAKRQLDLMGAEINYSYFGGEESFKKMVAEVRSHAGATSAL